MQLLPLSPLTQDRAASTGVSPSWPHGHDAHLVPRNLLDNFQDSLLDNFQDSLVLVLVLVLLALGDLANFGRCGRILIEEGHAFDCKLDGSFQGAKLGAIVVLRTRQTGKACINPET